MSSLSPVQNWLRRIGDHLTRAVFNSWKTFLIGFIALSLIGLFALSFFWFKGDEFGVNVAFSLAFGIFSIVGAFTSIAVLHHVKGVLPHWTSVSQSFEEMIEDSKKSIYIVSENPAFLQAFSSSSFERWAKMMQNRIGVRKHADDKTNLDRLVFVYPRREILGRKVSEWAKNPAERTRMLRQLAHDYIFGWLNGSDQDTVADIIRFVAVDVEKLNYFIFLSDRDRSAIFCRSDIKQNINTSDIKGFNTVDSALVEAFWHLFQELIVNSGVVYKYKCEVCHDTFYLTDDQICHHAKAAIEPVSFCDETPVVKCPGGCDINGSSVELSNGERVSIRDLENADQEAVITRIFD